MAIDFNVQLNEAKTLIYIRNILQYSQFDGSAFKTKDVFIKTSTLKKKTDFEYFIDKNKEIKISSYNTKPIISFDKGVIDTTCTTVDLEFDKNSLMNEYKSGLYKENKLYYDTNIQIQLIKEDIIKYILPKKSSQKDVIYPKEFHSLKEVDIDNIQIIKTMLILELEGLIEINNISTHFIYSPELVTFLNEDTDIVKDGLVTFNISRKAKILYLGKCAFNLATDEIVINGLTGKFDKICDKLKLNDDDISKTKDGIRGLYALYKINEENINNNLIDLSLDIEKDKNNFIKFYNEAKNMFGLNQTSNDITKIDPGYISKTRLFINNNNLSMELTKKSGQKYFLKRK